MSERREGVLVRLPPETKTALEDLARSNRRSTSMETRVAIEQHQERESSGAKSAVDRS
jgi:predicted transcriptional regulator